MYDRPAGRECPADDRGREPDTCDGVSLWRSYSVGSGSAAPAVADEPGAKFPKRVLDLKKPGDPPPTFRGRSLDEIPAGALQGAAAQLGARKAYDDAITLQTWAVKNSDTGRYNLACFCALAGKKDDAFYWLQESALTDGADVDWANYDPAIQILRDDSRWQKVDAFLRKCNDTWRKSGLIQTVVVLPKGYKKGTPIGVIVGLHGMGATPAGFVHKGYQPFADQLNSAIVSISGTFPAGTHSFHWSEEARRDSEHI